MFTYFRKILYHLEDKNHPSFGILLPMLSFCGLWHPELKSVRSRFKRALFFAIIAFFFTIYIKCLMNLSLESFKLLLQYSPFHLGVVKTCYFQKDYRSWKELVGFISSVERKQVAQKDDKLAKIMKEYITRNRKMTYFFYILCFFANFAIFTEPYLKNKQAENGTVYNYMFEGFTPFEKEPPGYYFTVFFQTILGYVVSFYVVCWDMTNITIMIFLVGQLRISSLNCSRVIDSESLQNSQRNIAECHEFHTKLVLYQKKFHALISPVMFFYIVIISLNLGICIIRIAEVEGDLAALVSTCVYMGAIFIELLMFYWHSNEVTYESQRVSYSLFESDWVGADRSLQRQVLLLAWTIQKPLAFRAGPFSEMSLSTFISSERVSYNTFRSEWVDVNFRLQRQLLLLSWTTSKRLAFTAGPFNKMTLSTFISILRGTYSFYTLLNETS